MTTQEVADRLVSLCREGKFNEATEELYSPNIESWEPSEQMRHVVGIEGVRQKGEWFDATFEVTKVAVEGPWLNEPFFIAKFIIDTRKKDDGSETHMEELALYQVEDGKIVSERFF